MHQHTDSITELASIILRHTPETGSHSQRIEGLYIGRQTAPSKPFHISHKSALALIVQGEKTLTLGQDSYRYGAGDCLVAAFDLPVVSQVTMASPEKPHLGIALTIEPEKLRAVLQRIVVPTIAATADNSRGLAITKAPPGVVDALLRFARLLDTPKDIAGLAPLIEQEILYRLLTSQHGPRLIQIATADTTGNRVAKAMTWLRENYTLQLRIEDLADHVGMSISSLHHHFKTVAAMTPMQYQKQLRLHEARRLMLVENMDAGTAGHTVGYQSPSQFGLEYSRLYGMPPLRDIAALRTQAAAE